MAHELHREDSKNGGVMEDAGHKVCAMLEKWATIDAYLLSQTKVNAEHSAMLVKLYGYVFENGLQSLITLNKEKALSDNEIVSASLKRLWWGVGLAAGAIISLLGTILVILLQSNNPV